VGEQLAKAGNQGPSGKRTLLRAYFRLSMAEPANIRRLAYLNDWCCIAAGSFVDMVIDSIFGADLH